MKARKILYERNTEFMQMILIFLIIVSRRNNISFAKTIKVLA